MLAEKDLLFLGTIPLPRIRYVRDQAKNITSVEVTREIRGVGQRMPEIFDQYFSVIARKRGRGVAEVDVTMVCFIHRIGELLQLLRSSCTLSPQKSVSILQLIRTAKEITHPTGRLLDRYNLLELDFEEGPSIPLAELLSMFENNSTLLPPPLPPQDEPLTVRIPVSSEREKQPSYSSGRNHPPRKPSPSSPDY